MTSKEITALLIRLALGLIYLTAGFSKLVPDYLGNIIGPVDLSKVYDSPFIESLMGVAAVYQIIAGALILSQRYSILGLILLFPLAVGILIFTIVAGFGGTPFINGFILLLLIYALVQDKRAVVEILKLNFKAIRTSSAFQLFPNQLLPHLALGLTLLTACLSFLNSPVLNVLLSAALLLFTINLFQVKKYLVLDKVLIVLFFAIGFIIINGIIFNQIVPKAFYLVFALIPLGLLLYVIRLIYAKFAKNKKSS